MLYQKVHYIEFQYNLYYIKQYFLYVRGLFAPTGHSFQDTDIWLILFDPKY